jgi:hypothetical protein
MSAKRKGETTLSESDKKARSEPNDDEGDDDVHATRVGALLRESVPIEIVSYVTAYLSPLQTHGACWQIDSEYSVVVIPAKCTDAKRVEFGAASIRELNEDHALLDRAIAGGASGVNLRSVHDRMNVLLLEPFLSGTSPAETSVHGELSADDRLWTAINQNASSCSWAIVKDSAKYVAPTLESYVRNARTVPDGPFLPFLNDHRHSQKGFHDWTRFSMGNFFHLVAFETRTHQVVGMVTVNAYRENAGMFGIGRCVPFLLAKALGLNTRPAKSLNSILLPAVCRIGRRLGCRNVVVNGALVVQESILLRNGFSQIGRRYNNPLPYYRELMGSGYDLYKSAIGYGLSMPL